jgi:hypothetical protein
MGLSEPSAKLLLDWLLLGATPTRPGGCWLGLATGAPNSRFASELSASAYARLTVTFAAAASPAGTASNNNSFAFGPYGAWNTILGVAIFDAASGGTTLWQGALQNARTLVPNDELTIPVGGLSCGLS